MSLFRTLKILCKIGIYFQVVYIHLLNRWLHSAVATFQKLGNNFQLATNEILFMPVSIRRPFPLCFPRIFPKELMETLQRFVWPSRSKWTKGNFTGSGWYLQWFLSCLRSYFLWILDTHQGIHIPDLRIHRSWRVPEKLQHHGSAITGVNDFLPELTESRDRPVPTTLENPILNYYSVKQN